MDWYEAETETIANELRRVLDSAGVQPFHYDVPAAGGELGAHGMRTSSTSTASASTRIDRKSTRLNSSHLVMSYAVFCLKKKKKQQPNNSTKSPTRRRTHVGRIA